MSGWYPAGTTEDHINALAAEDWQQDIRGEIVGWLRADERFWRRYLAAPERERRSALLSGRIEDETYYDLTPSATFDVAEIQRAHEIRRARGSAGIF